ncbi:MAG: hypothetical protein B7X41_02550 [Microbacterium sp. 14-71-5]|nr:MAG: hypothetical protein B7X41_02550 [Microbacterium sp. 14-71-5]
MPAAVAVSGLSGASVANGATAGPARAARPAAGTAAPAVASPRKVAVVEAKSLRTTAPRSESTRTRPTVGTRVGTSEPRPRACARAGQKRHPEGLADDDEAGSRPCGPPRRRRCPVLVRPAPGSTSSRC